MHRLADALHNGREGHHDDVQQLLQHMAAVQIHNTWLRDFVSMPFLQDVAHRMNRQPRLQAMAFAAGNTASAPTLTIASPGGWADALTAGLVAVLPRDAVDSWLGALEVRQELRMAHQVHDSRVMLRAKELYEEHRPALKYTARWLDLGENDPRRHEYLAAARLELAGDAPPSIH